MTARKDFPMLSACAASGGNIGAEARTALNEIDRLRQLVIEQWNTLAELAELAAIEVPS